MSRARFGLHRVRFLPPDLVHVKFGGDLSRDEARDLSVWISSLCKGIDRRYLVDLRKVGQISPESRHELAIHRNPLGSDDNCLVDVAFIGASLRVKVLMTTIVGQATITSKVKLRTHYFGSLPQALQWAHIDPALLDWE
jgi:hypothetical protein